MEERIPLKKYVTKPKELEELHGNWALGIAWSLEIRAGNGYKSVKSDLLACLKKKINLFDEIPIHVARVYDGMCLICQLPDGFDTSGDLSDYAVRRITPNNCTHVFCHRSILGHIYQIL